MNTIKLIAFDLDGTLLKDNKELTPRTLKALGRAADAGICLVPATGRLYDGVPEEVRDLPYIRYVISSNGAEVYDSREKRILYRAEMNQDEVQQFFNCTRDLPAIIGCYKNGKGYMEEKDIEKIAAYASSKELFQMMQRTYVPVENLEAYLRKSGENVQKMVLFFKDLEEKKKALEDLNVKLSNLAVSTSIVNNIEVNAGGANKGAALKFLREYLQIERMETAAFGDGTNDIAMLTGAGIGFAMGNACQETREAADKVTLSNEEEGVAYEMEQILQRGIGLHPTSNGTG